MAPRGRESERKRHRMIRRKEERERERDEREESDGRKETKRKTQRKKEDLGRQPCCCQHTPSKKKKNAGAWYRLMVLKLRASEKQMAVSAHWRRSEKNSAHSVNPRLTQLYLRGREGGRKRGRERKRGRPLGPLCTNPRDPDEKQTGTH